jgi:hypothetical protein
MYLGCLAEENHAKRAPRTGDLCGLCCVVPCAGEGVCESSGKVKYWPEVGLRLPAASLSSYVFLVVSSRVLGAEART